MKIYQTYRNADMTDGRGPMIPDLAFLFKKHADEYIDSKQGVMGIWRKWSITEHGDWQVREIDVLESSVIDLEKERARIREEALCKLTDQEREVLGLK